MTSMSVSPQGEPCSRPQENRNTVLNIPHRLRLHIYRYFINHADLHFETDSPDKETGIRIFKNNYKTEQNT